MYRWKIWRSASAAAEIFEFLPKLGKSSFLRKQESSHLRGFIDSRFRGNDNEGGFSKLSLGVQVST